MSRAPAIVCSRCAAAVYTQARELYAYTPGWMRLQLHRMDERAMCKVAVNQNRSGSYRTARFTCFKKNRSVRPVFTSLIAWTIF
jgi:hypothetical protein